MPGRLDTPLSHAGGPGSREVSAGYADAYRGLALWDLLYHGFHVAAFIHDELLVELPDQGGYVDQEVCERVKRIVCEAMTRVTVTVPIDAEYTLAKCWSKEARLTVKDGRVNPWEPESMASRKG